LSVSGVQVGCQVWTLPRLGLVMQNRNDPYENRTKHMRTYPFG